MSVWLTGAHGIEQGGINSASNQLGSASVGSQFSYGQTQNSGLQRDDAPQTSFFQPAGEQSLSKHQIKACPQTARGRLDP